MTGIGVKPVILVCGGVRGGTRKTTAAVNRGIERQMGFGVLGEYLEHGDLFNAQALADML
jgi:hypothetical protein